MQRQRLQDYRDEFRFLDVLVPCEVCGGKRYNRETLEVRYKGKSIADILDMTIDKAVEFFAGIPTILKKIKVLQEIGLGYIKPGQPSSTLSGGENQRVKLATELAKKDTGRTLFILDEPTTGLHFDDVNTLLNILNRLVDKGNTVVVIEHNLDVIKCSDYVIDMGSHRRRPTRRLYRSDRHTRRNRLRRLPHSLLPQNRTRPTPHPRRLKSVIDSMFLLKNTLPSPTPQVGSFFTVHVVIVIFDYCVIEKKIVFLQGQSLD